jgi:tetratricopeptide (TPR) repeat protein
VARRAVELGKNDAVALCWSANALSVFLHEHDAASALVDFNPNLAGAWRARGNISSYLGRHEQAIEQFKRAIRLNPIDPETHLSEGSISIAYLLISQYDLALSWATRALARQPLNITALRVSTLAHVHLGQMHNARKFLHLLMENDPTFSVSAEKKRIPYSRPEDVSLIVEGYRKAGLREQ